MHEETQIQQLRTLFSIREQTAIVTGGGGGLGSVFASALARAGASVVVLARHIEAIQQVVTQIEAEGGRALALSCDVTHRSALEEALDEVVRVFGEPDILVNGAGGNAAGATTGPEHSFFDLDEEAIEAVFDLNFAGTFKACQVFGRSMAARGEGCIVNIASMNSLRPLTRIPAYSAAKAAVVNFTQWLAVHMAQEYGPRIRVNALAPGFFLTEQNRFLLTDSETGGYTARGETILKHTPTGRLGQPDDLVGTLLWLVSPAAQFVTGITVPVDGGFSAFSGV